MKLVVFYYTQSGQALDVAHSICDSMCDGSNTIVFKKIVPEKEFPFPWSKNEFLNAMPECRLADPPYGIKPMDLSDVEDANLVMVVGQSWFLSPSLPIQSFFTDECVKRYLKGRSVIFVNACRNMWVTTKQSIQKYLMDAGANFVGHIVLQDEEPNLISVLTIIRWAIYGKKDATTLLPKAGIADADIKSANKFADVICKTYNDGKLDMLQERLLAAGGIHYKPSLAFMEKVGHRIFYFWANFIRKKGGYGDKRRFTRQNVFFAYLLFVLFVVSPFGQLFFYLTYPLRGVAKTKKIDCGVK